MSIQAKMNKMKNTKMKRALPKKFAAGALVSILRVVILLTASYFLQPYIVKGWWFKAWSPKSVVSLERNLCSTLILSSY